MSFKVTFGRLIALIVVVAALGSGTAIAGNTPQGLKADGLRLHAMARAYKQMQDRPAASHYMFQGRTPAGDRYTFAGDVYVGPGTTVRDFGGTTGPPTSSATTTTSEGLR
jgi:hypothetical protein